MTFVEITCHVKRLSGGARVYLQCQQMRVVCLSIAIQQMTPNLEI